MWVGVGLGDGDALGEGDGLGEGDAVGEGVGDAVALGDGDGTTTVGVHAAAASATRRTSGIFLTVSGYG